jgi:membrane-bound lytic murein transglycosylase A
MAALGLCACAGTPEATLQPVSIGALNLSTQAVTPGITAFINACDRLVARDSRFAPPCEDRALALQDPLQFLAKHFAAETVVKGKQPGGFFTGYFEPNIIASRKQTPGFETPIYALPDDLVMVDLGKFRDDLKGRRIAGRVANGRLTPFEDRSRIETQGLESAEIIAWAKDPVELFFLHIQGSGVLSFPDGTATRIGYAGQNGHIYTAIGRPLIARGDIAAEDMSLDAIANWLRAHPDEAASLMRQNRSYVFFKDHGADGPFGSLGTALPARGALAVDPLATPLGALVFVDVPLPGGVPSFQALLLAADTGGAIRGLGRGDIFFGRGAEARSAASALKSAGRFIRFLPKGWDANS